MFVQLSMQTHAFPALSTHQSEHGTNHSPSPLRGGGQGVGLGIPSHSTRVGEPLVCGTLREVLSMPAALPVGFTVRVEWRRACRPP
jgi:hypothetical protein